MKLLDKMQDCQLVELALGLLQVPVLVPPIEDNTTPKEESLHQALQRRKMMRSLSMSRALRIIPLPLRLLELLLPDCKDPCIHYLQG